jgi:hypothetical protein
MSYLKNFLEGYMDGISELDESVHTKVAKKTKKYIIQQVEDDDSHLSKGGDIQTYDIGDKIKDSDHTWRGTTHPISVEHDAKDKKRYTTTYQVPDKLKESHINIGKRDLKSKGIAQATVGHEVGHGRFASKFAKSVSSGSADPILASVAAKREYERQKNGKVHNHANTIEVQRSSNFSEYYADQNAREALRRADPKHSDIKMRRYFKHVSKLDKSERKLPNAKAIKASRALDSVDRKQAMREVAKLRAEAVMKKKDPRQMIKYKQGMAGGKKAYEKEVKKRKLQKKLREELLNYYLEN